MLNFVTCMAFDTRFSGIGVTASALNLGDRRFDSDPSSVIPKISKMVRAASLLDAQHVEDKAPINPMGSYLMGREISPSVLTWLKIGSTSILCAHGSYFLQGQWMRLMSSPVFTSCLHARDLCAQQLFHDPKQLQKEHFAMLWLKSQFKYIVTVVA